MFKILLSKYDIIKELATWIICFKSPKDFILGLHCFTTENNAKIFFTRLKYFCTKKDSMTMMMTLV